MLGDISPWLPVCDTQSKQAPGSAALPFPGFFPWHLGPPNVPGHPTTIPHILEPDPAAIHPIGYNYVVQLLKKIHHFSWWYEISTTQN